MRSESGYSHTMVRHRPLLPSNVSVNAVVRFFFAVAAQDFGGRGRVAAVVTG